jgi:hypothetical protein
MWPIIQLYDWYFNQMANTSVLWQILQSYDRRLPHYTLFTKLVRINKFSIVIYNFINLFKCLSPKTYLWIRFISVPQLHIWWLNLMTFLLLCVSQYYSLRMAFCGLKYMHWQCANKVYLRSSVFSSYTYSWLVARDGVVVKALCYKPEGRGFDSRWCHRNFSVTYSFRSHYGPEIHSDSSRNKYHVYFLWVKAAGA